MNELVLWTLVFAVISYFVCGIPFGLIISAKAAGVDVRTTGSGNIGTTNVARSVGKWAAAGTLLCDLGKGLLCMTVARHAIAALVFAGDVASLDHTTLYGTSMSVIFLACICGHVFSPYLHFRGGKGIAVGFGSALGLFFPLGWALLLVFVIFAVPTRYVSAGSLAAAASLPFLCIGFGFPAVSIVPVAVAAVVVIWSHRANIKKLATGTESKFSFHKSEAGDKSEGDVNGGAEQ